jgi:hypothetical protein
MRTSWICLVYPWPRPTRDAFVETLPGLPAGISEIFAHPVLDSEELRGHELNNSYSHSRHSLPDRSRGAEVDRATQRQPDQL